MANEIIKRCMYEALVNYAETGRMCYEQHVGGEREITMDELKEFAEREIERIDSKNAKARETAARKAENDELMNAVFDVLTDDYQTTKDILACIEGDDLSPQKVQYRLTTLVKQGLAEKSEVIVEENGKKNVRMGYRRADKSND